MKHQILLINSPFELAPFSFPEERTELKSASSADVLSNLGGATILATASAPLTYDLLTKHAPKLQLIVCLGTGSDHVNKEACRERGITLCNTPAQNIASVSEHAFTLLGALKRKVVPFHALAMDGHSWADRNQILVDQWEEPPRTNKDEVVGVIGYGPLGKGMESLAKALGMKTLIAERKGADDVRAGRMAFEQVLKQSTTIILAAPLAEVTRNMIDTPELAIMHRSAVLINVGRGGLVNEAALVKALREKTIAGAATDVFANEPATKKNSVLLDPSIPNLLLSPHVAWYSKTTSDNSSKKVHETIEAFVRGEPQHVVVDGRRQD